MTGNEVKDERLYDRYILAHNDYCVLCRALRRENQWTTRESSCRWLCDDHLELYWQEAADIQGGEADFPSGLDSEKARQRYLEVDIVWTKMQVLAAMAENGEITEEKAREQIGVMIRNFCYSVEHEDERKRRNQEREQARKNKMLPRRLC